MEPWILLVDLLLLAGLVLVSRGGPRTRQLSLPSGGARLGVARENLKDAAKTLGFEIEVDGVSVRALGTRDECAATIEPLGILYETSTKDPIDMQVILHCQKRLDGRLWLSPNTLGWAHQEGESRIKLGDPVFEQLYTISGPEADLRARFTEKNRAALLTPPGRFTVQGDRLCYTTTALFGGPEAIVTAVQEAFSGLEAVCNPTDVPSVLAEIGANDPEPTVRSQAFICLVTMYPDEEITQRACEAALTDPDPRIRLWACGPIAAGAADVLLELAMGPYEADLRLGAVGVVNERVAAELRLPLLTQVLDGSGQTVAALAAKLIGTDLTQDGLQILIEHMPRAKRRVAVQIAVALGDYEDVQAEPVLEEALRSPFPEVREAAAGALSAVGSPNVIPCMQDILRSENELGVRERLTWAINKIKARYAGESGRLSLSEPQGEGQLAIVQSSGALSVTDE